MPNSSPHSPAPARPFARSVRCVRRLACLLLAAAPITAPITAPAQTLARPGWAGSGLNADPWWKQAVFYRIDAPIPAARPSGSPSTVGSTPTAPPNPAPSGETADSAPAETPAAATPTAEAPASATPPAATSTSEPPAPAQIAAPDTASTPPALLPPSLYKATALRLDALRALGVDALLVPTPILPDPATPTADPALAAALAKDLDDFDELLHQASRRSMRVLLTFSPSPSTPDLAGLARFWLTRGVAGFHLVNPSDADPQQTQATLQSLRQLTAAALGQRIVLADFDPTATPSAPPTTRPTAPTSPAKPAAPASTARRRAGSRTSKTATPHSPARPATPDANEPQLQIDARLTLGSAATALPDAASLRPLLAQTLAQSSLLLDLRPGAPTAPAESSPAAELPASPISEPALARIAAVLAMTLHPASLIDADAELHSALEPADENDKTSPSGPEAPAASAAPATPPAPAKPANPWAIFGLPSAHPARAAAAPAPPTPPPAAVQLAAWYRALAALHHGNAAMRYGSNTLLDFDRQDALVWIARPASAARATPPVLVACNLSATRVQLNLGDALRSLGLRGNYLRTLLRSDAAMGAQDLNAVTLPPFTVYIGELHR